MKIYYKILTSAYTELLDERRHHTSSALKEEMRKLKLSVAHWRGQAEVAWKREDAARADAEQLRGQLADSERRVAVWQRRHDECCSVDDRDEASTDLDKSMYKEMGESKKSIGSLLAAFDATEEQAEQFAATVEGFVHLLSSVLEASEDKAPNFLTFGLKSDLSSYELTVRKVGKLTPAGRIAELEEESKGMRAALDMAMYEARWLYDEGFIDDGHMEDCPEDDTCECEWVIRINLLFAILEGRKDVEARMRSALERVV